MSRAMDPDRFQMKDVKRRLTSLEKSHKRVETEVDRLRKLLKQVQALAYLIPPPPRQ